LRIEEAELKVYGAIQKVTTSEQLCTYIFDVSDSILNIGSIAHMAIRDRAIKNEVESHYDVVQPQASLCVCHISLRLLSTGTTYPTSVTTMEPTKTTQPYLHNGGHFVKHPTAGASGHSECDQFAVRLLSGDSDQENPLTSV
jgi:hypothetical protein